MKRKAFADMHEKDEKQTMWKCEWWGRRGIFALACRASRIQTIFLTEGSDQDQPLNTCTQFKWNENDQSKQYESFENQQICVIHNVK